MTVNLDDLRRDAIREGQYWFKLPTGKWIRAVDLPYAQQVGISALEIRSIDFDTGEVTLA